MSDKDNRPDINPEWISAFLAGQYAARQLLGTWDAYVEVVDVWAKAQKARYDALTKEGFSPEQALELVKENIRKTGVLV
jgi:hypothetical protein